MPTPQTYYKAQLELDGIKGMAFQLLMSDEVTLDGPLAKRLADYVFDMMESEAEQAVNELIKARQ